MSESMFEITHLRAEGVVVVILSHKKADQICVPAGPQQRLNRILAVIGIEVADEKVVSIGRRRIGRGISTEPGCDVIRHRETHAVTIALIDIVVAGPASGTLRTEMIHHHSESLLLRMDAGRGLEGLRERWTV